jgi:hypothetical protein
MTFTVEKSTPKIWARYFENFFKKLPKAINVPKGGNSPNEVALHTGLENLSVDVCPLSTKLTYLKVEWHQTKKKNLALETIFFLEVFVHCSELHMYLMYFVQSKKSINIYFPQKKRNRPFLCAKRSKGSDIKNLSDVSQIRKPNLSTKSCFEVFSSDVRFRQRKILGERPQPAKLSSTFEARGISKGQKDGLANREKAICIKTRILKPEKTLLPWLGVLASFLFVTIKDAVICTFSKIYELLPTSQDCLKHSESMHDPLFNQSASFVRLHFVRLHIAQLHFVRLLFV